MTSPENPMNTLPPMQPSEEIPDAMARGFNKLRDTGAADWEFQNGFAKLIQEAKTSGADVGTVILQLQTTIEALQIDQAKNNEEGKEQ